MIIIVLLLLAGDGNVLSVKSNVATSIEEAIYSCETYGPEAVDSVEGAENYLCTYSLPQIPSEPA